MYTSKESLFLQDPRHSEGRILGKQYACYLQERKFCRRVDSLQAASSVTVDLLDLRKKRRNETAEDLVSKSVNITSADFRLLLRSKKKLKILSVVTSSIFSKTAPPTAQ